MNPSLTRARRTILLTGASGVVGQALLRELSDVDLVCLTHRKPVAGPNVTTVTADLTKPNLGLTDLTPLRGIDAIIHCAAVTGFSAGSDATNDLNISGTAQLIALAEQAQVPFYYVSTAFIARTELTRGRTGGPEGEGRARPEDYLDSKRAAEKLVREAKVPTTIIRPSVVIGDSRTGEIAQFQGLHTVVGAILKNALPVMPLEAGSLVDFVPQDLVARAIAGLVRTNTTGGEYWVTAGNAAITIDRFVDLAVQTGLDLGLPTNAPRLVSPDMVDRLIRPVFVDSLPIAARRRFDDMLAMTAMFTTDQPFPSSLAQIEGVDVADPIDIEWAYVASVRYFAEAKRLARVMAAVTA